MNGLHFGSVTPSTQPRDGSEKTKSYSGARRMSKGGPPLGIGWREETLGLCTEGAGGGGSSVGSRSDTPMSEATTSTNVRDTMPTEMSYEDVLRENERLKSIVEAIATSEKAKAALSKVPFKVDLQPTYQVPSKVDKSLLAWAPDKPKNRQDLDSMKRNLLAPSPSDRGPRGPGRGPPSAEGSCDPPLPQVRGHPRVCTCRRVCVC